jgi:eukaryotic-like serine/threonine-protein kinase
MGPFFSPDGQWIGFMAGGHIKKIPSSGGTPVVICAGGGIGANWGLDNTILIGGVYTGILRVSANGGKPVPVVTPAPPLAYLHPQFLPDGRSFLYQRGRPGDFASNELVMRSLEKDDETVVLSGGYDFRYLKSGYLLYAQGSNGQPLNLAAVAFDPATRKVSGSPITVVNNVQLSNADNSGQFAVSDSGTLTYLPALTGDKVGTRLAAVSRSGEVSLLPTEARDYSDPRVSPDGRFVAAHLQGDQNDVWVADVSRGTLTRLSYSPGEDETPVWSPDGRTVAWASSRPGLLRGIFRRPADGSGSEELIWKLDQHAHVRDWSPDGRALVLEIQDPSSNSDIWRLDLEGTPAATVFLQTPFSERNSRLSPDGHWLAYVSDESGRDEIYIQSFPQAGSKLQVSSSGGNQPVWSRDGRNLFFRGSGTVQEIAFEAGARLSVSKARSLFADRFESPQAGAHTGYDIFPDGRFLMIQSQARPGAGEEIVVVFNWIEELKREVPGAGR